MGLKLNEYHEHSNFTYEGIFWSFSKTYKYRKYDVKNMSKHNPVTFTMSVKHINIF